MFRAVHRLVLGSMLVLGTASFSVAEAGIVNVNIAGTFGDSFNGNPVNPAFPNPGLINGNFVGTFSFDDAAAPVFTSGTGLDTFDVLSNTVQLRTPANVVDYTITIDGNNEIRLITGTPGLERMIIFLGDSTTGFPDDLRLAFDISGLGIVADGSALTAAEFINAVTNGTFLPDPASLLDVEAVPTDLTLGITSARVTVVAPVPEPATAALFAAGLAGLLWRRRSAG